MNNKVYTIPTDCDTDLQIETTKSSITGFCEIKYYQDNICLSANDSENEKETYVFLTKDQALELAEKIIKLAKTMKSDRYTKSRNQISK